LRKNIERLILVDRGEQERFLEVVGGTLVLLMRKLFHA